MIFMNFNKSKEIKPLNVISEDAIRLLTKINFLNDKDISSFEFEEYIDNTILYFESRLAMLEKTTRIHYNNFTSMRKSILKELKICDELNININMREPNDMYYKLPDNVIMRDFTNITFDKIYDINTPIGKDISQLYNLDHGSYNNAVKLATLNKITKSKDIIKLYDIMSKNVNITNKEQLEKYLDNLTFPHNDINVIKSYISGIIRELRYVKQLYKNDTIKSKKIVKCTNVVAVLSMYRKNVVNILLNIYSVKLSILNLKPDLNESIDCVDDIMVINTSIINESLELVDGNITKALDNDYINNCYKPHLDRLQTYLDNTYQLGLRMLSRIDKLSIIPYGYNDTLRLKKLMTHVKDVVDLANPCRYIESVASLDSMECNNIMEYLTPESVNQRVSEFREKEVEITNILKDEYNIISRHISYLKNHHYGGNKVSLVYERPLNQLGVYSNDFRASILRDLQPLLGISPEINKYIHHGDMTDMNLMIILRQIDVHFNNDEAVYWRKKIMNLAHFTKISFVNTQCTGVEGIANGVSTNREYGGNNDVLIAYLLYFKNKVYNI